MRRHISSKSGTCTETVDVDAAGISGKVTRITLGGLIACLWLPPLRSDGMGDQKSAEAIVGCSPVAEGLNMWNRLGT
jgi:hypothetical protein